MKHNLKLFLTTQTFICGQKMENLQRLEHHCELIRQIKLEALIEFSYRAIIVRLLPIKLRSSKSYSRSHLTTIKVASPQAILGSAVHNTCNLTLDASIEPHTFTSTIWRPISSIIVAMSLNRTTTYETTK